MPTYDGKPTKFEKLKAFLEPFETDDSSKPWSDYPCAEWTGSRWIPSPFGRRTSRRNGHKTARRTALLLCGVEVPDEYLVVDRCGNPNCIRPVHIYARKPLIQIMIDMLENTPSDPTQCVEWPFGASHNYGRIYDPKTMDVMTITRAAWEYVNGPIPNGFCMCHHCDNPPCFRISHLFLDTRAGNSADAKRKGRHARGEKVVGAKLTETEVKNARAAYDNGERIASIARRHGRSPQIISDAVRRITWAWLK
jgi:HNH endonuclease